MKYKEIHSVGAVPSAIMIVGDNPKAEELANGLPFTGYTYTEFGKILQEAGISINTCYRTHVVKYMPAGGDASVLVAQKKKEHTIHHITYNGKEVLKPLIEAINHLKHEIELVKPNVIIAMGNVALFALTGLWSIHAWRSSLLECTLETNLDYKPKVIPTYPIHTINKMYEWRWIMVHDLKRAVAESNSRELIRRDYNFTVRPTFVQTISILKQLYDNLTRTYMDGDGVIKLSVDIETKHNHIECIALAWSETESICIPFHVYIPKIEHYWTLDEEAEIMYYLVLILQHEAVKLVGQNWAYDDQYLFRKYGIDAKPTSDTMINQHVIFSNTRKSLDFLSSLYLKDHVYWKDEGEDTYNEERWTYNCKDACITFEIESAQQSVIEAMGKRQVANIQNKLYHPVMRSMRKGIRWNHELAEEYRQQIRQMTEERQDYLNQVIGFEVNINSPLQMSDLFYRVLNQPKRYNKEGSVSCDDEALTKIAENEPLLEPITSRIAEIRSLKKCSDFLESKLTPEGRITTYYNIAGTDTYRFSSTSNAFSEGSNLQNLTDGTRNATLVLPNCKKLLIPDPGHIYWDADFDSADLRIVAASANEQGIFDILNEGKKVYVEAMKEYFKNPNMTKNDPHYVTFKALCHGTNYLGSVKGLAKSTGLLVHEVDLVQKWYFGRFPNIKKWQNEIRDQANKRKMVENVFGYKLFIFKRIEGTVINEIIAWIPQSTIAILVNLAYIDLSNRFPDLNKVEQFDVLQQTHDSLSGQFPIQQQEFYTKAILDAMQRELKFDKPIVIPAEVHCSEISWGDCK